MAVTADFQIFLQTIGLAAQTSATIAMAIFFALLVRNVENRSLLRNASRAWFAYAFALIALSVRHYVAGWMAENLTPSTADLVERALQCAYQLGKLAFLAFLLRGVTEFARGEHRRSVDWKTFALLGVYALLTGFVPRGLAVVVLWHVPLSVTVFALCAREFGRLESERSSFGTRFSRWIFRIAAVQWTVYGLITFAEQWVLDPKRFGVVYAFVSTYSSLFDALLQLLLGCAMVVAVFQELEREKSLEREARAAAEKRLARGEKLRALGGLVSGVAHEINNPLTAILGYTESLIDRAHERDEQLALHIIRTQAQRCTTIVQDLVAFAGGSSARREPVAVREIVERVLAGLASEVKRKRARVKLAISSELSPILADPRGLEQVATHLLLNALEAIRSAGEIRVRAEDAERELLLIVEDDGVGIEPAALERIFEPFFTTKSQGEGHGLGLAISDGIVRAHGGELSAENRASGGARFCVRLPRLPSLAGQATANASDTLGASESRSILVVDDEPSVRELLVRWCRTQGWRARGSADGAEALTLLLDRSESYDAVLCDVTMPCMSGIEMYDRLLSERAELATRTIFITGDTSAKLTREFASRSRRPMVYKPFDFSALRTVIENTLSPRTS